ncbi:YbaB/EbfC family nucleoid-associated protein [Phytomonospora sp. NPDC050363]|uniref:YbaB/EbfC family nucleoid-associated protein n=1 Tax=Phytomonospora sp. NPDC050363 TaxID=3155642 RepID=UPI0033D2D137
MSNAEMLERAAEVESLLGQLTAARRTMLAAAERAEDLREQITDERVEARSPDGLARVVCDGHGKLQRVELDTVRYNRATEEQLCAAVLTALSLARGRAEKIAAVHWREYEQTARR